MLPANLISSLQALSRSAKPLIIAENNPVGKLEPGQQIQATLREQISPGIFKVEVAGQTIQMQLPGQFSKLGPGQQIQATLREQISPGLFKVEIAGQSVQIQLPGQFSKLEPGQQLQATIQEQVSPGLFKVLVAGQTLQMQLPGQLKVGNVVTLKVESASPRLTLSFLASTTPIATADQISSTSRLLSNLADLPLARTLIESTSGRAVWQTANSAPDSKQLAAGLRDALANSGLFYESHQAQWVAGERSTAQLLIEPQNQLIRDNTPAGSAQQADTQTNAASSALQPDKTDLPIARELLPLVQQQLHALETHQLTWTGQVWPGQQMQWEIQGEPEHRPLLPAERQWSTEMELALPRLGDVHAPLIFGQGGIKLTLHAANAASVELLNRQLPGLALSMKDAGIPLAGALIEKT